jgi:hypothetical protein
MPEGVDVTTATFIELQESVKKLLEVKSDKKIRRLMIFINPVVEAIREYSETIGLMAQAYPVPCCLIWGGLKIILDGLSRSVIQVEKIKDALTILPDRLWELTSCEKMYGSSPYASEPVQRLLARSYKTIFHFLYRAVKVLEHPLVYFTTTDQKLMKHLVHLQEQGDQLTRMVTIAQARLNQKDSQRMAHLQQDMSELIVMLAIEHGAAQIERELNEKERQDAKQHREADAQWKEIEKLRSFQAMLGAADNQFNTDFYESTRLLATPSTCQWLKEEELFQDWTNMSEKPIFWLNGKHGSGKSVICASMIESLSSSSDSHSIAFQFITKNSNINGHQIFRNIAHQLLDCFSKTCNVLPDFLRPFLNVKKNDASKIEELVKILLQRAPKTTIFFDGLDEVEYADEERKMGYLSNRAQNDLARAVIFFADQAIAQPDKVRLWCSSQPTPLIEHYLLREHKHSIVNFKLNPLHTKDDIQKIVTSAILNYTDRHEDMDDIFPLARLCDDADGSFLWITSMIYDWANRAEDQADLLLLAEEKLPKNVEKQYEEIIEVLRRKEDGFKSVPLWRIVLSLLVFSARPLLMSEIVEGVAISRTDFNQDLNKHNRVEKRKILQSCKQLVRVVDRKANPEDGFLRLSHTSVHQFLLKRSDLNDGLDSKDVLVDYGIMRDCCIKYLLQPRYSSLLKRCGPRQFCTAFGESVESHALITYAAKYWHTYFDYEGDNIISRALVEGFMQMPNFLTCIQIQSIYVVGHFMNSFDQVTGKGKSMRRTLPTWMKGSEIFKQYSEFATEWEEVLQQSLFGDINGEVDRCFWEALNKPNLLSHYKCRYKVYALCDDGSYSKLGSMGITPMVGPGQESLLTCCVRQKETGKTQNAVEGDVGIEAQIDLWLLNSSPPILDQRVAVEFTQSDCGWDLYSIPSQHQISLPPTYDNMGGPHAFALHQQGTMMNLGSKLITTPAHLTSKLSGIQIPDPKVNTIEEIASRDEFLIVCRRRVPKTTFIKPNADGISKFNLSTTFKGRDQTGERDDDHDSDDSFDDNTPSESGSEPDTVSSHCDESSSMADSHDSVSDLSEESLENEWDHSDSDISYEEEFTGFEFELESNSDGSDIISNVSDMEEQEENVTQFVHDDELDEQQSDSQKVNPTGYPVRIGTMLSNNKLCNQCGRESLTDFYHCHVCRTDDYDLCISCEQNGLWCYDAKHTLSEVRSSRVVGIKARSNYNFRQEMVIYRQKDGIHERIFHRSWKMAGLLYHSPPVMHPRLPVAVWALTGYRLLLVDFARKETLIVKQINTTSSNGN